MSVTHSVGAIPCFFKSFRINYKDDSVPERVRKITGGRGVDRVVEVDVAGNATLIPKIIAQDGLCTAYGSNAAQACFDFGPMILSGVAVRFFIVYELSKDARERGVSDLTRWMEEGRLNHAVAMTLPLERTAEAHELLEKGKVIGNIVLQP